MIAILGGAGAAVSWAVAVLATSRAARQIGAWSTLGLVMAFGLIVTVPIAAFGGGSVALGTREFVLMGVIGVANIGGLFLVYTALRGGNVSVVAPIVSTEGAIAAVIAVLAGERLAPGAGPVLGAIVVGVVLATRERRTPSVGGHGPGGIAAPPHDSPVRSAALALGAALAFGVNIYLVGLLGSSLPAIWTALPARILGTIAVAIPLLVFGRLRVTRRAAPLAAVAGVAEVAGTVSLAWGPATGSPSRP